MNFKGYRDHSRINYGNERDRVTLEQINCGSLMRIADATEKMCLDRERLERDYKHMREERDRWRAEAERLGRSNAALRGVVKKMKRGKQQ